MFCPYCGTENDNGTTFCQFCGNELSATTATAVAPNIPITPANTTNTPSYTAPNTQAPAKPAKSKKTIDIKKLSLDILFYFLLAAAYFGLSFIMFIIFSKEDAISATSAFDSDISKAISLKEFCSVMINGNTFFNPTGISTALAIGMYIAVYGTAPVAAIAFLSSVIGKKKGFPIHLLSVFFSILSASLLAIIVPISTRFVPNLKIALAEKFIMLRNDIGDFDFSILIIFAALILVMTLLTIIFTAIANKRRETK